MQSRFRLSKAGSYPCVEIDFPLSSWNGLMYDNLSLLSRLEEKYSSLILFSFKTGTVICEPELPVNDIERLLKHNTVGIAAGTSSEKLLNETLLFKTESFDITGHFFAAIEAQTKGETQKAIEKYCIALEANPKIFRALNLLGLCQRLVGNNEEAEKCYLKSIEINPESPEALSNLGVLYLKTGRESEAEKMFFKALNVDEFYLNALLNLSRIYMKHKKVLDSDYLKNNLKLRQLYSSLPSVFECLSEAAALGDMSPHEYSQKLDNGKSLYSSAQVVQSMNNIENLILNSAFFAALDSIRQLLDEVSGTFHYEELLTWCRVRVERIKIEINRCKYLPLLNHFSEILAEKPELKIKDERSGPFPLTRKEFFSLVILEVMRDGQIEAKEKKMVMQLKNMLEISDNDYQKIINKIRSQVSANPFIEKEPRGFQPGRLFRSLVRAALRDRILEEEEKRILVFASRSFGLSADDTQKIMTEVANEQK